MLSPTEGRSRQIDGVRRNRHAHARSVGGLQLQRAAQALRPSLHGPKAEPCERAGAVASRGPPEHAVVLHLYLNRGAIVGEDHVALGSDFDGSVETTFDTSELAALTHAMLEAGLTPEQIRKVAGENMLRVIRARLD